MEIESEILKAKRATFSSTDIVINRQVMLDLVTRLRASYPIVLKEAEQIKKERDDILSKAEAYANKTMDAAEEQARAMMSDTEVLKKASEEAEAMRAEAHARRGGGELPQDGISSPRPRLQHPRQCGKDHERRSFNHRGPQTQAH